MKKPPHDLRREYKWFKENNTMKKDTDLVLQVIDKQYPQYKTHKINWQNNISVFSGSLKTRQPSRVFYVQSPFSLPVITDTSIRRQKNKNIYISDDFNKNSIDSNNCDSKVDINKQSSLKSLQTQGQLRISHILPLSSHKYSNKKAPKTSLYSTNVRPVKTNVQLSIPTPSTYTKNELIYSQNKLIKLLMVKIDLLTEKCDVLASTFLSEDSKKIQISGRIVPFNNNFTSKN